MSTLTSKSQIQTPNPVVLKTTKDETFSANYVIHAYNQGIIKGKNDKVAEMQQAVETRYTKNFDYTISSINDTLSYLLSNSVIPTKGWVKCDELQDFDVIIAVPQKDYLSKDFHKFYEFTNTLENKSNNPNYHINIRCIKSDKNIKLDKLISDGYELGFDVTESKT